MADLRGAIANDRVGHAYLFLGPEGIGRRTLALLFAQAMLCEAGGERPCDSCRSCLLVKAGTHPDLSSIEPEGGTLRIEQMRSVRSRVAYKPMLGKRRVFLLAEMERMTEAAANSFLLTLEEPPPGVVFLGWALAGAPILPTILSRCQVSTLRPLSAPALARALMARGVPAQRAEEVAEEAEGLPGKALAILAAGAGEEGEWRSFLGSFLAGDLSELFQGIEGLVRTEREALRERLSALGKILAGAIAARACGRPVVEELASFTTESLWRLHRAAAAAEEYLRANANIRLVLEVLALAFHAERSEGGQGIMRRAT